MNNSSHSAGHAGSSSEANYQDETAETIDRVQEFAGQAIDDLQRCAADYVEQGKQTAAEMTAAIEQQIRQRPVEAVAVAAGIGFALGLLWSRRS